MTHRSVVYELVIDLSDNKYGVACPIDQSLIGPVQYGWDRFQKDPNSMTFGGGLLAGSPLPGTRRMIFSSGTTRWRSSKCTTRTNSNGHEECFKTGRSMKHSCVTTAAFFWPIGCRRINNEKNPCPFPLLYRSLSRLITGRRRYQRLWKVFLPRITQGTVMKFSLWTTIQRIRPIR